MVGETTRIPALTTSSPYVPPRVPISVYILQFSPIYSMAKFGVIGFVRALAKRLAPDKIRVNAICPGPIDTPMLRVFVARPDQQQAPGEEDKEALIIRRSQQIPMRRTGKPEEIANAALFLLSDEASFVSGAALPVDGAATA